MTAFMPIFIIACLAHLTPACVNAQSGFTGLETTSERGDFIGNSRTIPSGHVQIESGLSMTYTTGVKPCSDRSCFFVEAARTRSTTGPESVIRIGIDQGAEFRIQVPDLFGDQTVSRAPFPVVMVGVKLKLASRTGLHIATTIMVPFNAISDEKTELDPEVTLSASFRAAAHTWFRTQAKGVVSPSKEDLFSLWSISFLFGFSATDRTDLYIGADIRSSPSDFFGDTRQHSMLLSGLSYTPYEIVTFDFRLGVGVTAESADAQFGAGLSLRV